MTTPTERLANGLAVALSKFLDEKAVSLVRVHYANGSFGVELDADQFVEWIIEDIDLDAIAADFQ
jgi:hypothetical protein